MIATNDRGQLLHYGIKGAENMFEIKHSDSRFVPGLRQATTS